MGGSQNLEKSLIFAFLQHLSRETAIFPDFARPRPPKKRETSRTAALPAKMHIFEFFAFWAPSGLVKHGV